MSTRPQAIYTIGYEGTPWQDERGMARELAQHLKMPLHEVELTCDDMVSTFAQMTVERDEPIAEIASTGMRAAMRCAREHGLPVMLSGLGGDELFWGYGDFPFLDLFLAGRDPIGSATTWLSLDGTVPASSMRRQFRSPKQAG